MAKRKIRLLAPAFIDNHLHEAGAIVEIDARTRGPHATRRIAHDRIDYGDSPPIDANRVIGKIEDVPLFEEVKEGQKK